MWEPIDPLIEALIHWINTVLNPIGIVVGLVLAVPVFWTWWEVAIGRRRRERRWFYEISRRPGERPAILIVDLLAGRDVRPAVEQHRQQDDALRAIPAEHVFCLSRDADLTPADMPKLREELRALAARVYANGTDTLHYFHAGPTFVAAMVGAEFANGCRVMLYGHSQGSYMNFGPLRMR